MTHFLYVECKYSRLTCMQGCQDLRVMNLNLQVLSLCQNMEHLWFLHLKLQVINQ